MSAPQPEVVELGIAAWLGPLDEAVSQLWSEILLAAPEQRRIVITGIASGDGATTVAAAAALGLARNLRRRTLLIESNVHRPSLAGSLGVDGPGFAEFCRGEVSFQQAIRATDAPQLHAMTAGNAPVGSGLFAEKGLVDLLAALGGVYDRIILDAAPVAEHPDSLLLVRHCDAAVIVARAHASREHDIRAAAARLRAAGVPIVGAVLNQVRRRPPRWLEPSGRPRATA
jgi:capsular exopolysaccharide synthesis family protein